MKNYYKYIWTIIAILSTVFAAFFAPFSNSETTQASGAITGRVFQDFNSDGVYNSTATAALPAVDAGIGSVTVKAYDNAGTLQGTAVSGAAGTYSLAAGGTGPYRVEFTNLPNGFYPSAHSTDSVSGGAPANAGSTVQFVPNGNTADVNLAVNYPADYSQNNPELATPLHHYADQITGVNNALPALLSFPYSAGTAYTSTTIANYDSPTAHTLAAANQIGTVWGLGWAKQTKMLYAASIFKRHSGFGKGADNAINTADDAGAIYVVNTATNTVSNTFTVPNAAVNAHNPADYLTDNGNTAWDAVGKTSLGGMDLSEDEQNLYVMNLENRSLYRFSAASGTVLGSQAVPTPSNCPASDVRPFAVKQYRGQIYVGMVCSAESTALKTNLRAYIYTVDPATLAFAATPVLEFPLNYTRGRAYTSGTDFAFWLPWSATYKTQTAGNQYVTYPQPQLTGIAFDNGNLILGLTDRIGDQIGNGTRSNPANTNSVEGVTAGDTLRACGSPAGGWTLEVNGRCGGAGIAPQNTGQGPSNGEFYYQDDWSTNNTGIYHHEITKGGVASLPGSGQVVTSVFDPIDYLIDSNQNNDMGFRWLNSTTGGTDRAYRVENGNLLTANNNGKSNGLGDIEFLSNAAPIEIGNRVWRDLDGDGIQDPNEVGIAGVTVHLYDASGNVVATAVTDANGEYYFSSATGTSTASGIYGLNLLPNSGYSIRLDNPANYQAGGPLNGIFLTVSNTAYQAGFADGSDSDGINTPNPAGSPAGTFPVINLTTGGVGANNHTYDFGFSLAPTAAQVSVSGRVLDNRWKGISAARVTLTTVDGRQVSVLTNSFGNFTFNEVESGQSAVVAVTAKGRTFAQSSQFISTNDAVENLTFIAN